MSPSDKNIIRDHLIKNKLENMRKQSVEAIVNDYINSFKENKINLRIIFSPESYPYYEKLEFDPNEFDEFFNQISRKSYSLDRITHSIKFFDERDILTDYSGFNHAPIPDLWINLSSNNRSYNSIIIKNDGVIFFNYSQYVMKEDKILVDLEQLSIHMEILFSQIILKIYEKMNYDGRLKIDIESSEFNNCYLRNGEPYENIKSLRTPLTRFKKSYILDLQNPISINNRITQEFRRLFQF